MGTCQGIIDVESSRCWRIQNLQCVQKAQEINCKVPTDFKETSMTLRKGFSGYIFQRFQISNSAKENCRQDV